MVVPAVVVRGVPYLHAGSYSTITSRWTSDTRLGLDARIIGELENTGLNSIAVAEITVILRDLSGNLLGRASGILIGPIIAGGSEIFEVFVKDVFPEGGLSPRIIEIEITYAGSNESSLWTCTQDECTN